ncbi:hypothetical protein CYK37_14970 [Mesorhizobium loti]|nr:hypothetical protein [Mesorhizobium loti]PLP58217.1 hypothetical protein CYK37_14970 [Mesorhizobium loti]
MLFRQFFRVAACLAAMSGAALGGNMEDYKNVPTYRMASPHECDADDVGRVQVSCKYIEVGSIDGYSSLRVSDDPRWPKLEKYRLGGTRLKFAGIACARADREENARKIALGRAATLAKRLIEDFEETTFTGQLSELGFNKYDDGWKCTKTDNTSGSDAPVAASESEPDSSSTQQQTLADQQAAARERAQAEQAAWRRRTATFIITNNDRYTLGLGFFSRSRNAGWPGGNKQYVLSGTETYNLTCQPGEKICFGAWRNHQTKYWGSGRGGREACTGCCIKCGGTFRTALGDGGADSYPQTSSSPDQALETAVNVIGLGAVILQGLNDGGGGTTYAPAPRARAQRQSGISGN